MASWNHSNRPVFQGEVVQHPNRIADIITLLVREPASINMQRLNPGGVWQGRAHIDAAELILRSNDMLYALQNGGHLNGFNEDVPFVDQIGEPTGLRFWPEFRTRCFSFLFEQVVNSLLDSFQKF